MDQKIKTGLGAAIIIIFAITAGVFVKLVYDHQLAGQPSGVVDYSKPAIKGDNLGQKGCTQEAKLCSDGSAVGRTGANCEFAPCPGEEIAENPDWKLYRNERLGFEINLPRKTDGGEVKAMEVGDIVWFYSEGSYGYQEDLKQLKGSNSEFQKAGGVRWAILVKKVNNDQELEQFIKSRFGEKCGLGKVDSSEGTVDLNVISKGEDCVLNFQLFAKYSPKSKLVAAWDTGQDVSFVSSDRKDPYGNPMDFDEDMANSFRFVR
jgi:hypothetical protein